MSWGFTTDIFNKMGRNASMKDKSQMTGFDKQELQGFMKMSNSLNKAQSRVDTTAKDFGPQFQSKLVDKAALGKANTLINKEGDFFDRKFNVGETKFTNEFSKDQVQGFIDAFKVRQDEVFGRRAQPGISQTRLV